MIADSYYMGIVKGLDIGKRAIMMQGEAVKIAGQNIANVSIPGYSRQKLQMASVAYAGTDIISSLDVRRIRDKYVDLHIRNENQALGEWEMKSQLYGQIENAFLEPSENGLNNTLSKFWNSWEDLSNNPENLAPRSVVVQQGMVIAETFKRLESQLRNIRTVADEYIKDKVTEINDIASKIAEINTNIVSAEAGGDEASEIRDSRDLLIEKMSKLVNISVIDRENGSLSVLIGGRAIVDETWHTTLETRQVLSSGIMISDVMWTDDNSAVRITGGELSGLMSIRDEVIPEIIDKMNQLASTLIEQVNAIHRDGYGFNGSTGLNFFSGTGAYDIQVNSELSLDVRNVAASGTGEPGSNSIALAIAALADENIEGLGGLNIGGFYTSVVNTIGSESQSASMMRENSEVLLNNLEEQKESVSGVSLDEETADLIRFQRAYESAARYIAVIDEMIKTLIDMR